MDLTFRTIEERRATMKIATNDLCAQAGYSLRSYYYACAGRVNPSPATLAKLNTALNRFRLGFGAEATQLAPHATYRACLVLAAFYLKSDPRAALASDPSRRANANREWSQAAAVRQLAIWIANGQLGFGVSDLARAAGVTKQAVSAATRAVEDDEDLAPLRAEIEEVFG